MDQNQRLQRAIGALVGLAVGDALGTTLEFALRDQLPHHTEMVGGGPFDLEPGEWTDDTSMALCLADSLLANQGFDPIDVMDRYVRWWRYGENSSNGECFDIGNTTCEALLIYEETRDPMSGPSHPLSSGNGSLMRLAPVPIFYQSNIAKAIEFSALQSRTTHASSEAVDACKFFATLLVKAIGGAQQDVLFGNIPWNGCDAVNEIAQGTWKRKSRDEIRSTGYVIDSLEAAVWCVHGASSFEEAVVMAVNLGDDADTVGAITGQLAGALWSSDSIPQRWLRELKWRDHIEDLAKKLFFAQAQ